MSAHFLIPTEEELRILTKTERWVYQKFRFEGWTKEEICAERRMSAETFRGHWSRATNKLKRHRQLTENPQHFLMQNKDVLRSDVEVQMHREAPTMSMRNVHRQPNTSPGTNPISGKPYTGTVSRHDEDDPKSPGFTLARDLGRSSRHRRGKRK